jgi:hypothetical protein
MMQEHRQQAHVERQLSALARFLESFQNLNRWRFLQIFLK